MAKLQTVSACNQDNKSREKDTGILSKISYYDQNKENDFKD